MAAPSAKRILLYEPLLKWYLEHGAVLTKMHRTIDYEPRKVFTWFVERRTGDVDKSKALLGDMFKLLGNSDYSKVIEAVERQTNVVYTKDENVVDRALPSVFFIDLEKIGDAYELERRKPLIKIAHPFQVVIAVYQLGKLWMLEFYYDFLDKYVNRKDFELIQMDTDSKYMAISGNSLEDVVRPERRTEFESIKN